jgi:GTP-binding protein Era
VSAPGDPSTRCGIVALVGAPNAGKSTLLNRAVGTKVSIVTHKVQTTRTRVRGIAVAGDAQLIFMDTPGIFAPKDRLQRAMVAAAWAGVQDADLAVFLFDAQRRKPDASAEAIARGLADKARRRVLVLNKIDAVPREELLGLADALNRLGDFERTFMISASKGDGVDDLIAYLVAQAPPGPWLFPEDQVSDLPMRLIAAEVTREKLFVNLHQELPYALTVETEAWEEFEDGSVKIDQTIYLQREAQKRIAIGAGGRTIRKVREQAQAELQEMLERPVHLYLFVKVRERWIDDPARYRDWGLDWQA